MRQNTHSSPNKPAHGQSLVELALVMPVVLLLVIGMLEVVFTFNDYLQMLDGSRNGARNTADSNPIPQNSALYYDTKNCGDTTEDTSDDTTYFFRKAACNTKSFLLPLDIGDDYGTTYPTATPPTPKICIDKDTDEALFTNDIVLTIFTTTLLSGTVDVKRFNNNDWSGTDPTLVEDTDETGWSYFRDQSQIDADTTITARGMCSAISKVEFTSWLLGTTAATAAPNNAYYVVEVFYNHYQLFDAPVFNELIPNPTRLYNYTIFSISAAEATATDEP